jgi:hypothetical protein
MFTTLTLWLTLSQGITKKLIALIFIVPCMLMVITGNSTFILYEPEHVNYTNFTYSGSKVTSATNTFFIHTLTRETIVYPIEIKEFLINVYGLLLLVILFLLLNDIFEIMTEKSLISRARRK